MFDNTLFGFEMKAATSGVGAVIFKDGTVVGADTAGVTYDGTYTVSNGSMTASVTVFFPRGTFSVQGNQMSQDSKFTLDFTVNQSNVGRPFTKSTPLGDVQITLHKLRDLPN